MRSDVEAASGNATAPAKPANVAASSRRAPNAAAAPMIALGDHQTADSPELRGEQLPRFGAEGESDAKLLSPLL